MTQTIYTPTTVQGAKLGEELTLPTNRVYRYAKNGIAPLAIGTVVQAVRPNEAHSNLTCAAAAAKATSITVTLGTAPANTNEYAEGYLFINDAAGQGYVYDVISHPFAAAAGTLMLAIRDDVVAALTTSSQATLLQNVYDDVNKPYGGPWDIICGVVPVAVPANEYFWCQVRGPAVVLQEGAMFAGRGVMASQDKPGAVSVAKQVVPISTDVRIPEMMGGVGVGMDHPTAPVQYSQKAVERRPSGTGRYEDDEILVDVSGKATIPERVLGYCINPRVSTEYALVYLTIN